LPARVVVGRLLILLVVALALAGCGKKGAPQPPPDEPNTYPRVYPSA
jgi:predicted small lipoprotein YifL